MPSTEVVAGLPALAVPRAAPAVAGARIVVVGGSVGGLAAAACLRAAGFSDVRVLERSAGQQPGAGIGLDDASSSVLKGLGVLGSDLKITVGSGLTLAKFEGRSSAPGGLSHGPGVGSSMPTECCMVPVEIAAAELPRLSMVLTHMHVQKPPALQTMRLTEERWALSGERISRQAFPYMAVRYAELQRSLSEVLPPGSIAYGRKVQSIEPLGAGALRLHTIDAAGAGCHVDCDLVVAADGPRSLLRRHVAPSAPPDLRFAGYAAWRGTVPLNSLSQATQESLRGHYNELGNCLYFVWGVGGEHAVLYDIGNDLINWLVYTNLDAPAAEPGRTTTAATAGDIQQLRDGARARWGEGGDSSSDFTLGGVIEETGEPFMTDVYDLHEPLESLCAPSLGLALLGDSAHAITPHMAKGSNLAIHDAFVLASSAAGAGSVTEMLTRYSQRRTGECRNTLLLSRHLGRVRNRLLPSTLVKPIRTAQDFDDAVHAVGLPTRTLPDSPEFEEVWKFVDAHVPVPERGFFLERQERVPVDGEGEGVDATCNLPPPRSLAVKCLNHVSIETTDVERLRSFYSTVLGLSELSRPDFGFGGAWLQLSPKVALHIIERDPLKPDSRPAEGGVAKVPEKFIRRSHHTALTVEDIDAAKSALDSHSIPFAINTVPETRICQLFFYDPDGNGIEIGNFP